MHSEPDSLLAYLTANPNASRQEAMKACGVSARVVRQAEDSVGRQRALRRRRRRLGLLALVAISVLTAVVKAWVDRSRAEEEGRRRDQEALLESRAEADKQAIYDALDAKDPRLVQESLARLEAKDESLRLAALRYLARIGDPQHSERVLRLVEDASSRVRLVAIQTAGELPGAEAYDVLVSVASNGDRQVNERMLALASLRCERGSGSLALARRLIPLLGDPSPLVRVRTASALERLSGRRLEHQIKDPQGTQAAWLRLLGEGS